MSLSRKARLAANTVLVSAACLGGCPHVGQMKYQPGKAEPLIDKDGGRTVTLHEVMIVGKADPLAEALRMPRVGVIGPSDVHPGFISAELQRLLRRDNPKAVVHSYGIGGQDSALILKRFAKQMVGGRNNIAVISGLTIVNEWDPKSIYVNFPEMFSISHASSIPVIVYGPTPFAGLRKWSPRLQRNADEFDSWLRTRNDIVYVDVTSLGTPLRKGGPLRLKRKFDSGDGLHPGVAGCDELAKLIYEEALKPHMHD